MKQPLRKAAMPRIASMVLFSLFFAANVFAQPNSRVGKIAQRVQALQQKGVFSKETALFKTMPSTVAEPAIASAVKKFSFIEAAGIETIQQEKPDYLSINIPVDNGSRQLKVLLYKENISPNGFTLQTDKGMVAATQNMANYRGSIDNDPASLAAFTFANNEVSGFVSNSEGNYVIGQSGANKARHIIYNDADLAVQAPFDCGANTAIPQSPATNLARETQAAAATSKCVNWYWETDYDLFTSKGSLAAVTTYMQAVFNQMATLYANDGMTMLLKTLYVWTTEDPYTGTSTSSLLDQFGVYRTSFDGDLAHLIGLKGGGGIAWINGLCKSNKYKMAYSGISSSYQTVPVFSWTVECITHEQGHLLGSQHTHDCSWNGNNTKIDGCGDNAGYTSGSCANPGNPSGGGTIMSYCHLLSGVGINFNLGFGPQPTERIINTINAASCVSSCTGCSTPSQPAAITGSTSPCAGTSQTYSVAAVSGATSYTWTLPSGFIGTSTTNSITVTSGTASGTLSVSAENSCGKSSVKTLAITIAAAPAVPASITGSTASCPGSSQIFTAAAVSGATSYTWALPSGWSGTSTTNSITVTVGTTNGNISVTASNTCGSSTAKTMAVTASSTPAAPASIAGNTAVCPGTSQTFTAAAVSGATSYTWALPSGFTGTSTTNSITATTGTTGGQLTVKANTSCGQSAAAAIAITIASAAPAQPGTITGNATVCAGTSQTYSVAAISGAASYTWVLPSGWTGTSASNAITVVAGAAGNMSVSAVNGCGTSTARILAVTNGGTAPAAPGAITVSDGAATVCSGNTRTYTTPLVSGLTYNWKVPAGATIVSGQNSNRIQLSFASSFVSGSVLSVTATSSCGNSAATAITINKGTLATPGAISGSSTSTCNRYKQYSVPSVSGATSYVWAIPAGSGTYGSTTGRSIWVRLGSTSGNITVKAVSSCGTSAASSKYITVSCSSGIEQMAVKQPASVYPNPATGIATVRFTAEANEACTVSLMDVTGRVLSKQSLNAFEGINTHSFDVAKYLPGTYFVMVQGKTIKEALKLNVKK